MSNDKDLLIEQWLEGSIDEANEEVLAEWLKQNPAHMLQFVEANLREQMLRDVVGGEVVAKEIERTTPALAISKQRLPISFRTLGVVVAIAAGLLLAIGWFWNPIQESNPVQPFSSVAFVSSNNDTIQVGDRLADETVEINEGVVRLVFDNGVEITLQGPARYELVGPNETRLRSGLLTASVPPDAEGFRINTASVPVEKEGTTFGIETEPYGASKVSVFDGEVEVFCRFDNENRRLTKGETGELDSDGQLTKLEFAPKSFSKLWPAASGIESSTGAFEFAPQWPRPLNRIESDTNIYVLPEGYAIELDEDCPVDMVENEIRPSSIPAGQRVRSFLLQFNPKEGNSRPNNKRIGNNRPGNNRPGANRRQLRRIKGSITFDRPVVGLMIDSDTLKQTDRLFSVRRGPVSPMKRGLELSPARIADSVSLSDDRRTVTLNLVVFDRLSDHVRVVVDASIPTNTTLNETTH